MKIRLSCFHPEIDNFGKAFIMLEKKIFEFDRVIYKCPKCDKEIFVTFIIKDEY